jgi:AAA domain-containing protein
MSDKREDLGGFLGGISYGIVIRHIFCLIFGPNGVGKTQWGSNAPNPVFIDMEAGSEQLKVARLPRPQTLNDFRNLIQGLKNQEHSFKTLVIDPLDYLELLIWRQVCAEDPNNPRSIEQVFGGYGKGYTRAYEIWRGILRELTGLVEKMHVILIANSKIKRFDDPKLTAAYDRYELALNPLAAGAVRQAVDAVLFASFNEKVRELSKNTGKGIGEGNRIILTEHRPAFDAKNRFNLPFELPLEWKAFAEKVKEFYFGEPGSQERGAEETKEPAPSGPEPSAPSALPAVETKETDEPK